jgi:hypothetical protein|nr:MAG TPA: hypothetical protein [Caudoviricetes sp.]
MNELQSSILLGTAVNNPNNLIVTNNVTKGNKLGNIAGKIGGIAQAIPGAINTLASPFQQSTATTGGEAAMQSL